jgi:hypothetical protein
MKYQDQQFLEEAYSLIREEKEISKELEIFLMEEGVWDTIKQTAQKGGEMISNATELPQKIAQWSQESLPEYIIKMSDFINNVGWQAVGGVGRNLRLGPILNAFG